MHLLRCCNKACFLNFRYGLKRSSDNLDSSGLLTTKLLTHQNVYLTSINKFSDRFKVAKPLRFSNFPSSQNKSVVLYSTATVILFLALSFAAVPLYRIYCQSTGKGGRPFLNEEANKKIREMVKRREREITVHFNADTSSMMAWKFRPTQPDIKVAPGETALAFFTAKNPLPTPIDGIATYSIAPYEAGLYFNKIQCFCFEEQRLNPNEEVDMPVFFYIDPSYAEDPRLENVDKITLSYTFFQAKPGMELPFLKAPINQQPTESQLKS